MSPKNVGALNIQIPTLKFQTNFKLQPPQWAAASAELFFGAWELDSFLDLGCWNLEFLLQTQPVPEPQPA